MEFLASSRNPSDVISLAIPTGNGYVEGTLLGATAVTSTAGRLVKVDQILYLQYPKRSNLQDDYQHQSAWNQPHLIVLLNCGFVAGSEGHVQSDIGFPVSTTRILTHLFVESLLCLGQPYDVSFFRNSYKD